MPPLVYCDQNFVATAHDGPEAYRARVQGLASTRTVTYVFSPWHWVDMAEDANVARSASVADFIDSISPAWLYERRNIQEREVSRAFYKFIGLQIPPRPMIGDINNVLYELTGTAAHRDTRAFVAHIGTVGPDHPLRSNLRKAYATNQKNSADFRAGKITAQIQQDIERLYIQGLLPAATPSGVVIDASTKNAFLNSYAVSTFPSIALEHFVTQDNWTTGRQLSQNNFLDQQHIMALPYVDWFVTDDKGFKGLMRRAAQSFPFRTAEVLTRADFDARFP
jgi:hypothetical protein